MNRHLRHILPFILLVITLSNGGRLAAQQSFTFSITEDGLYLLRSDQLKALGFQDITRVKITGQPYTLDQTLSKGQLFPAEIPSLVTEEGLLVFLSGPHQTSIEAGKLHYDLHPYTESASYQLQSSTDPPLRIQTSSSDEIDGSSTGLVYQLYYYHKPQYNILSSGRDWYGLRTFSNDLSSFNFPVKPYTMGPIYVQANMMAQSTSLASLTIESFGNVLLETSIEAVPSSTYGIKGREKIIEHFSPFFELGSTTKLSLRMSSNDPNATAYLKYFLLGLPHKSENLPPGIYHSLKTGESIGIIPQKNYRYWEISDIYQPAIIPSGGPFTLDYEQRLLVADQNSARAIETFEKVEIDLASSPAAQFIIISSSNFRYAADKLASHKQGLGISTLVTSPEAIYDSYNAGTMDITAIRNFIAHQYHTHGQLKFVLFMGKGTFDYKGLSGGYENQVPTYSSRNSLDPLRTFSSDDYFGLLAYGQGQWEETSDGDEPMAIGLGRIPVISSTEALQVVDKIIDYENLPRQIGNWKNKVIMVADDGDNNIHLRHSENHSQYLNEYLPIVDLEKIYLDAYPQTGTRPAQNSEAARKSFADVFSSGALLVNYIGHGNEQQLTEERLFETRDLEDWPEADHLPVFITATCEFGRHDSPYIRSGAEAMLSAKNKGSIALLTTGRPVYSSSNYELNRAFMEAFVSRQAGAEIYLGDLFKDTKNQSLNGPYNRNFSLLGDPSMRLASYELAVQLTLEEEAEEISSGKPTFYSGQLIDPLTGMVVTSFDGEYTLEVHGDFIESSTLGDEGNTSTFFGKPDLLFQGSGEVIDGGFTGSLKLGEYKEEIRGPLRVKLYAVDTQKQIEGRGISSFGAGEHAPDETDLLGPSIHLYAGDSVNPVSITDSKTIHILANVWDDDGLYFGNDENYQAQLSLNGKVIPNGAEFFKAVNNSYILGLMDLSVSGLKEGENSIVISIYDLAGNRSSQEMKLIVEGSQRIRITKVQHFPNPATEKTNFRISHNRATETILVKLAIYNILGQEIYSSEKRYVNASADIVDLEWFFLGNITKIPAKGTYIYRLQLLSESDGTSDQANGKIVIQ